MTIESRITGQVLESKTATFKDDDGNPVTYGKVQLLVPDQSGDFHAIQNIKCNKDNFAVLVDIEKHRGKKVSLNLSTKEFKGKTTYYVESIAA